MKRTEIDGIKVVYEFKVLYHEWECDGYGWVTADGRVWHTNHGSLCEIGISDIHERIGETRSVTEGLIEAMRLVNHLRQGETE